MTLSGADYYRREQLPMTNQNTINKLMEMCLFATVDAFRNQLTNTGMTDTSFNE